MEEKRSEFAQWLQSHIDRVGGLRAAAKKVGCSHSTLLRAVQDEELSLKTLKGISQWTGVELPRLLRLYGEQVPEERHLEAELAVLLDTRPELRETLKVAIDVLDDQHMAEIIDYIQWQIDRNR